MAIFDLFSTRNKKAPDIFTYDDLPKPLRVQVVHIIHDAFGTALYNGYNGYYTAVEDAFRVIHSALCREYGVFKLGEERTYESKVINYFLAVPDVEHCLDVIQLTFRYLDRGIREDSSYRHQAEVKITPDEAIEEMNERFKQAGVGYCYESGQVIRIDSLVAHTEITLPTIKLLWNTTFQNANDEYLRALEHYCHGRNKECLNECLKAFESTMKIICAKKGWAFNATDSAKKLIAVCFANNLIPAYMQSQFNSLQNLIESGIPTIRNKVGGHGQGQTAINADDELTRYAMNLTGANIIFLVEQSGIK